MFLVSRIDPCMNLSHETFAWLTKFLLNRPTVRYFSNCVTKKMASNLGPRLLKWFDTSCLWTVRLHDSSLMANECPRECSPVVLCELSFPCFFRCHHVPLRDIQWRGETISIRCVLKRHWVIILGLQLDRVQNVNVNSSFSIVRQNFGNTWDQTYAREPS